jgi:hypothetical protein
LHKAGQGDYYMELYFGSMEGMNDDARQHNLVTFNIPDLGVNFKAPFPADSMTLEYAALLTLLEFIDINPQLFSNRALELFSDNSELVSQVNNCRVSEKDLIPLLQKALQYRSKLKFSINLSPPSDNPSSNIAP